MFLKNFYGDSQSSNRQLTTWLKIEKIVTREFSASFAGSKDVFKSGIFESDRATYLELYDQAKIRFPRHRAEI